MIALDAKIKAYFFDKEKVLRAASAGRIRALSKAGAFIRRRGRSLLRRRKRSAAAGQPPSVHSTDDNATLKKIVFAYDPQNESVVVGPVKLNGDPGYAEDVTVPELMEFGGVVTLRRARVINSTSGRGKGKKTTKVKLAAGERLNYADHPFMGPALEQETAAGTIADAWSGCVRSA